MSILFNKKDSYTVIHYHQELQEQKSRKDMETRSEEGQFEEVTVQQLPQEQRAETPVSALSVHYLQFFVPSLVSNGPLTVF